MSPAFSGTFSALDAYVARNGDISGDEFFQEFIKGAGVGAVVGSLGLPPRVLAVLIAAAGGWSVGHALNDGQYKLAIFRSLSLGLSGSIFSRLNVPSAPPTAQQLASNLSNGLPPPVGTRVFRVWGKVVTENGVLQGSDAWGPSGRP